MKPEKSLPVMNPPSGDKDIIDLYFARDERALRLTEERYGRLCMKVALEIVGDRMDAEECVSDAYIRTWNTIPPHRPPSLCAYLCRIVRNLSLNRLRDSTAERRNKNLTVSLSELEAILPAEEPADAAAAAELSASIDAFLRGEDATDRRLFIGRYWYALPVKTLAREWGLSPNAVSLRLYKTRERLRAYLTERGYTP